MREYGKIHSAFWMSESVRLLSDDGKMLALYLLTCPHGNMLGCFRIPDGYVSDDLGWPLERVSKGFNELFDNGFSNRCSASKWVLIYNFLEYNPFENPNVGKAAGKVYSTIPSNLPAKAELTRILRDSCPFFPVAELNPSINPSQTLSNSVRNPEPEPEPEPEPNQSLNQNRSRSQKDLPPPSASAKKTGTTLPGDWILPKAWGEWALTEKPGLKAEDIRRMAENFKDFWCANSNRAMAKKADWLATWRVWVRNQQTASLGKFKTASERRMEVTDASIEAWLAESGNVIEGECHAG